MTEQSAYARKLEAQLAEWRADIDKLEARLAGASAERRLEIRRALDDLERQRREAARKVEEIKVAGEHAVADLRIGLERLRDDIRARLDDTAARLG